MEALIIVLIAALVIGIAIFAARQARKRREALAALAARMGLRYYPDKNRHIDDEYRFLSHLGKGSNRYAENLIQGIWRGYDVRAFDYHYQTHSTDSKGRRRTHHHYFSFFILLLPKHFPELTITREGFLSKIAQFVGYEDIDFESAEFSKRFCVRSVDKKFAYDICHAQMMEYLLHNHDLSLEIENHCLALYFGHRLSPEQIEHNLIRLVEIRDHFPDYILNN